MLSETSSRGANDKLAITNRGQTWEKANRNCTLWKPTTFAIDTVIKRHTVFGTGNWTSAVNASNSDLFTRYHWIGWVLNIETFDIHGKFISLSLYIYIYYICVNLFYNVEICLFYLAWAQIHRVIKKQCKESSYMYLVTVTIRHNFYDWKHHTQTNTILLITPYWMYIYWFCIGYQDCTKQYHTLYLINQYW